jgi:hypothetical protein
MSEVHQCADPSVQAKRNNRNHAPGYGLLPAVSLREMRCEVLSFFICGEDQLASASGHVLIYLYICTDNISTIKFRWNRRDI